MFVGTDLRDRVQAAKAAWQDVGWSTDEFLAVLASSPDTDAVHDADFYLARACACDAPGAMVTFERVFMSQVPAYLRRLRASPSFVDEVQQLLRAKLFVGPPPQITEYAGTGPLTAWLRVTALRTAFDLKRTRGERPAPT